MNPQTVRELMMALFGSNDPNAKIEILTRLVFDLFIEVEALREALIQLCPETSGQPQFCHDPALVEGKGAYASAYVNTAHLSHNAAGPTGGMEKVLGCFYSSRSLKPGVSRESLMLSRLGFSQDEIARFCQAAEQAEQFT